MRLEMNPVRLKGVVKELVSCLEDKFKWTVNNSYYPTEGPWNFMYFKSIKDASSYMWTYRGTDRNFKLYPTELLISEFNALLKNGAFKEQSKELIFYTMNLNNLENLKADLKTLGFRDETITKMEENMRKDIPDFDIHEQHKAPRGQVDLTLLFKQSGRSDFYYFPKYQAIHNQGKGLEEGQKYLLITKNADGKNMVRKMDNVNEAITMFKEQKGNSELAVGKDAAHKQMLANMEDGNINYVAKEFSRSFYSQPMPQTFWIEGDKGFNAEQAVNLVQGRAVYRDDMLTRDGVPYKAWMQLDTDTARDRHNNLSFKQYVDPSYGFDIKKSLESFNIKEMQDPKKAEILENRLKNGDRPLVTVVKDGKESKLHLETAVRYGKLNFYQENGKPEKREQFLKDVKESITQKDNIFSRILGNGKGKDKELEESQGLRR